MKKALVSIIAVILLLGISGCGNVPATHEELSSVDVTNARTIATAINAKNALHADSGKITGNVTLEDAKKILESAGLWPMGLSDGEARAAWKLIVIKNGEADLVPEAQGTLKDMAKYAWNIAKALRMYQVLHPSAPINNDYTLEEAKERIDGIFWPAGLSEEEERAAWKLIVIDDQTYVADLTPEAQQALQKGIGYESDEDRITNATIIAAGINAYNIFSPNNILPNDVTLEDAKEALGEYLWPPFLTNAEDGEAWKLIEISDGVAKVKE